MNLTRIEYFLEVAKRLSYTVAAKELYISQPALSKQISLLEESLGVRLFYRDNKKVELTIAGQKLRDEMSPLVKQMGEAIDRVKLSNENMSHIRIGCFSGLDTQSMIEEVEKRLYGIGVKSVEVTLSEMSEMNEQLKSGEIDLGIILDFSLPHFNNIDYRVLKKRNGAILYSCQHVLAEKENISLEDFNGHTFVSVEDKTTPGCMKRLQDNLNICHITPKEIITVPNMMTLASYIDRGRGVAILSANAAMHKMDKWIIFQLPEQTIPLKILGVCEKSRKIGAVEQLLASYNCWL